MNIEITESGDTLLVSIDGNIETTSIRSIEEKIPGIINHDKNVRLDLMKVGYVDSSGIRILLTLWKKLKESQRELKLINCSENISRILRFSSLKDIL